MHRKFNNADSRCNKGQENDPVHLLACTGVVSARSNTVCAELEAQAEIAFPAGKNNPTVVCCHGISTMMLFLSRSSQQSGVAHETVDLTLCYFNLLCLCSSKEAWVLYFF